MTLASAAGTLPRLVIVPSAATLDAVLQQEERVELPVYQTTAWPAAAPKRTMRMICHFDHVPKLSAIGAVEVFPSPSWRAKSGDSCKRRRM